MSSVTGWYSLGVESIGVEVISIASGQLENPVMCDAHAVLNHQGRKPCAVNQYNALGDLRCEVPRLPCEG